MEAVRDPDGREIVESLLLDWERQADEGVYQPGIRPDFNAVRKLLRSCRQCHLTLPRERSIGEIAEAMAKPRRDSKREDRIRNEVIVDTYNAGEQVMGWYCYLEDNLRFPFRAKCVTYNVVSPLRKGEVGEVSRMAPEDACFGDMLVLIRRRDRNVAVPLSQSVALDAEESTIEAISDWHYWVARSYVPRDESGIRNEVHVVVLSDTTVAAA
jgi:hypothetical protein